MQSIRCVALILFLAGYGKAQVAAKPQAASTARELTTSLNRFMRDASSNNRAGFDRFFADELIYTGSNGVVHSKADIMRSLNAPQPANASREKESFSAQDILVRNFGDTAIVAFQLVARTQGAGGKIKISYYRDTGTFLRRNGHWQAIAWQATKIPEKTSQH